MRSIRYIATNLKLVLDRQGIKARTIAREIGRSPSFLSMVVRGERTVGAEEAQRIANVFRLPVELLFREEGDAG